MSRIGKKPVEIPSGVDITIGENNFVKVKGPKGELSNTFHPALKIVKEDNVIKIERPSDEPFMRAIHGTTRALLANMVQGVVNGFTVELEIVGIGYRAAMKGKTLELQLGYSHPIVYEPPEGIQIAVEGNIIKVSGIDKQLVGQVAAEIRDFRKPDPYKGKGIRYKDEQLKLKPGKSVGKK
ncbi:50S ribosomal protein L6 [Hydrogenivirga sp. 128-5-R1-1]|uniref:50S ribosomal protein L6 n=1 Tax=Hydrogenivirga sp. 128-5-R1-1 TaxID=392423 RepID=UPI00015F274D|nr:50S ribosomal protein L6 [Hydrogenivirga sp. 128-5-R1-1]EDP73984.1 50S ribosomal protein L6 [Hydrogenivirga sp. 128-5-R1-1]